MPLIVQCLEYSRRFASNCWITDCKLLGASATRPFFSHHLLAGDLPKSISFVLLSPYQ